jgi:pimeloyl-ACP methyl ester carboxylesterase
MAEATPVRRRRAWRWWLAAALAALLVLWAVAIAFGMNPSVPSDAALNLLPTAAVDQELTAPGEGRCLVVLQHGLWRSAWSLWRLERALREHGYEVLNVSYPSTAAEIGDHARALDAAIDAYLAREKGPPPAVYFVGHSLGGLVIRAYLARDDAVRPSGCVFVATPHRGAAAAARSKDDAWFRLLMGGKAARQLVPGHPFYESLPALRGIPVGTIVGGKGDGAGYSASLPGDDDGTVTVEEARCGDQTDTILLRLGHTRIGFSLATIECVLRFLRTSRLRQ